VVAAVLLVLVKLVVLQVLELPTLFLVLLLHTLWVVAVDLAAQVALLALSVL
jgi:hypothetical protein